MIVWILFIIFSVVLVLLRINKKFGRSLISLVLNVINIVVSFGLARFIVHKNAIKGGKLVIEVIGEQFGYNIGSLSAVKELVTFIGSITISIMIFYLIYFLMSLIMFIIKHTVIYHQIDEKESKLKDFVSKPGIVVTTILSVVITFVVLVTPFGLFYNKVVGVTDNSKAKATPFVSDIYFDKLTEIPNNDNDIKASNEIDYTLKTFYELIAVGEGEELRIDRISNWIDKAYFLPTIVAETGSNAAKNWKNGEEYLGVKIDIPNGREGKLYTKSLEIIENWNNKNVKDDIRTLSDVYQIINTYAPNGLDEKNTIEMFSDEETVGDIFITLYKNKDFAKLIPIFFEYGLGTAFDYVGFDLDDDYSSNVDVTKLSEEDIRSEAKIISGIVRTTSDIYKVTNGKNMTTQDYEKIIDQVMKLKDSKILGSMANDVIEEVGKNVSESF